MSNNILFTQEGLIELKKELNRLITEVRPEVIRELKEAREQGDLSENADYDAAKNEQAKVEARIKEIEAILETSKVITKEEAKSKLVRIGSTVTIKYLKDKSSDTFKIVNPVECDPLSSPIKISNESPLARLLIGKTTGDIVEVKGVQTPYTIEITKLA